ncbi:UDP-N-acetylglucosamine 2-epimerase, partial [Enterobacter hormaechei]|uniref:UDP-N-acetylglucosamine 2-epimerase n=1 Tax=Enterobacter hormaechei TaxID=158836 RepID=UPI0022F04D6B
YPDKAKAYFSLGTLRFLSIVEICNAIIGNSSSGILEAPSLKTATLNIGDRQKGRIQADSIVNVENTKEAIALGFQKIKDESFIRK